MSWSSEHIDNILLYKFIYTNIEDVKQRLIELVDDISTCNSKLKMFTTASPSEIIPKDNKHEPINWLNDEVDNIIALLNDYVIQKYELELYLKSLEENIVDNTEEEIDNK